MPTSQFRRSLSSLTAALIAVTCAGCLGYRVGADTLYAPDVRTVYVPMIESDSFRRDLGERLTEAVVKEIELKTPYKVIGSPNADSVLDVSLLPDRRRLLAEDALDNPRLLENQLSAVVSWQNRRRLPLVPVQTFALPGGLVQEGLPQGAVGDLVGIDQTTLLFPEAGQTIASQQQLAITRLAEQIVSTMETPW